MTLIIPDEVLSATRLNEHDLLVELACHLFETRRISLAEAARLAGMKRPHFEDELQDRRIAIHGPGSGGENTPAPHAPVKGDRSTLKEIKARFAKKHVLMLKKAAANGRRLIGRERL